MNKALRKQLARLSDQLCEIQSTLEKTFSLCSDIEDVNFAALDFQKEFTLLNVTAMLETIGSVTDDIDEIRGDEIEKFENLSEGLQGSEKGEALETTAESLGYALEALESVASVLNPEVNKFTHETLEEMLGEAIENLNDVQDHLSDAQN